MPQASTKPGRITALSCLVSMS